MLKKRLIFTLLLQDGIFQLSRNFSLQAVGDIRWLWKHFAFHAIARSVDELVLLDVGRGSRASRDFARHVAAVAGGCFMPIAAGGGIRSRDDAFALLGAGADKLVVNTPLFTSPGLVEELAATFGSQCLVGSIDYRRGPAGTNVFYGNGAVSAGMPVEKAVRLAEGLGVGEIYLTSIDKDGTGQGYDFEVLRAVAGISSIPVIASGGVGDFDHFVAGMSLPNVNGAATANIFHFVGDGLREARDHLLAHGIELARWEAEFPAAPPRS